MRQLHYLAMSTIVYLSLSGSSAMAQQEGCSPQKVAEITTPATATSETATVNCNLTLQPGDRVTKRLILKGSNSSNVRLDCNGATLDASAGTPNFNKRYMLEIRSVRSCEAGAGYANLFSCPTASGQGHFKWTRPENIEVRNCNIKGAVRIWGMQRNGEGEYLRESSRVAGHVARVRLAAPTKITLDNNTIEATGQTTPLYISPGVTRVSLTNSEVKGSSVSVAIYLDTESDSNLIANNYIHTDGQRELFAIDASSRNRIINNRFSALNRGGIYLYRNCGEEGTVRHNTPSHNTIINNIFYYNNYTGMKPSVYLGSRNGNRSYCDEDDGYAFGSSIDNRDFARYNTVMQNQIYKRSTTEMIVNGNASNNVGNNIAHNTTVSARTVNNNRLAGCFDKLDGKFLIHGQAKVVEHKSGNQICTRIDWCDNSIMQRGNLNRCTTTEVVPFGCLVTGSNNGCRSSISCPTGSRTTVAKAMCNLEYGSVSPASLSQLNVGVLAVQRPSDHINEGQCHVGTNKISTGTTTLQSISGYTALGFGCKEHDSNGGDCHISGEMYCKRETTLSSTPDRFTNTSKMQFMTR